MFELPVALTPCSLMEGVFVGVWDLGADDNDVSVPPVQQVSGPRPPLLPLLRFHLCVVCPLTLTLSSLCRKNQGLNTPLTCWISPFALRPLWDGKWKAFSPEICRIMWLLISQNVCAQCYSDPQRHTTNTLIRNTFGWTDPLIKHCFSTEFFFKKKAALHDVFFFPWDNILLCILCTDCY